MSLQQNSPEEKVALPSDKQPERKGGLLKVVARWFTLETIGNFFYDQIGAVWRSALMVSLYALVTRSLGTIPPDVRLMIGLFVLALAFFSLDRYWSRKRRAKAVAASAGTAASEREQLSATDVGAHDQINKLEAERDALKEKVRLLESAEAGQADKDAQITKLRDKLSRWNTSQLEMTLEQRTHNHLGIRRREFYVVVKSHIAIDDLRVEIEELKLDDKIYYGVPLLENAGQPPYRRIYALEPEAQVTFLLASIVDGEALTLYTSLPEIAPEVREAKFYIIAYGSNTIPRKKQAIIHKPTPHRPDRKEAGVVLRN